MDGVGVLPFIFELMSFGSVFHLRGFFGKVSGLRKKNTNPVPAYADTYRVVCENQFVIFRTHKNLNATKIWSQSVR